MYEVFFIILLLILISFSFVILFSKNILLITLFFVILILSITYFVLINKKKYEQSLIDSFFKKYKDVVFFKINYKENKIYFLNKKLQGTSRMSLPEFAIRILKINATSTEVIAMYIGKLDFETFKEKNEYIVKCLTIEKDSVYGYIKNNF